MPSAQKTNVKGKCSQKFAAVEKAFSKLFESGCEYEGASVAIYHKGELVVDLVGGYADKMSGIEWTADTRAVIFSLTKAVAAVAVSLLVERGHVKYSDRIATFWPEFAKNGKEAITLDWILTHKAGLAAFDVPITLEDAENWKRMGKLIEGARPNWEPGTKSGFGWLVDQVVRRVDPAHRGIGQFIKEEITDPHGIDFHMGIKPDHNVVARISLPSKTYILRECLRDPRVLYILAIMHLKPKSSLGYRVMHNPEWLKIKKERCTFNNPRILQLEQCAAIGISRAKDVGKIFALLLEGKLVSPKMVEAFANPQGSAWDTVIKVPMWTGHGFLYQEHPTKRGKWLLGHPGYGSSNVLIDTDEKLVMVYLTNGIKMGMGKVSRPSNKLFAAALKSLENMEK